MKMTRLFLGFLLLLPIAAQATMQDVRVLAVGTDSSPAKAEALALDYARKRAVYLVARKLPVEDPGGKVSKFTPKQFEDIIRGATVLQTKRKGEMTYADVTVTIVDSALHAALGLKDSATANDTPEHLRGVVVLPVYVRGANVAVWKDDNKLAAPLRSEVLRQGRGALMMPAGDLDDLRLIDQQNALTVSAKEMAPMLKRYGAEEMVIAIFTAEPPNPTDAPSIILRRLTPVGARTETVPLPPADKDQSVHDRAEQAARLIAGAVVQIASSSAEAERKRLEKATKMPLAFLYANARELAQMQEAVRAAAGVLLLTTPTISLGGDMQGVAYFDGEPQKLRESLSKAGIIVRQKDKLWQLSYR